MGKMKAFYYETLEDAETLEANELTAENRRLLKELVMLSGFFAVVSNCLVLLILGSI